MLKYPKTKKVDHVDDYFGTKVEDPYRWFEESNNNDLKLWVEEQKNFTQENLDLELRDKIRSRLDELVNYERLSAPFKEGENIFYFKNNGLQNHSVLYIKKEMGDEVFLDPNTFSKDGTTSLEHVEFSKDGKYCAYGISKAGSDWIDFYVKEVESGEMLDDHITWIKWSSVSFRGNGFFYPRFDEVEEDKRYIESNKGARVMYHKLGTSQEEDIEIYREENKEIIIMPSVTEDERFLILEKFKDTKNNVLLIKDLEKDSEFISISDSYDSHNTIVDNREETFYMFTNKDAPNNRLVSFSLNELSLEDVIPQREVKLEYVTSVGGKFFANFLVNVTSKVEVFDMETLESTSLELPGIGLASGFYGKSDYKETYFSFQSFSIPHTTYHLDLESLKISLHKKPEVLFDTDLIETKQVWYSSKDGTKVPMFLVHKKGLELNSSNPTFLYGYGGFGVTLPPYFSPTRMFLLEQGFVYAQPSIRGGGEFGDTWHREATKLKRQNAFDDFISAAEFLIDDKYTSENKLVIAGGSNGGLLVGACMTQRPELFKVALPAVGVMDMLRFHKFTEGRLWVSDYGSSDNKEEFEYLLSYSPYHNIKQASYPATFVTTSDHDDRVVPAHSYKFISRLQERGEGELPYLIRIETDAGHNPNNLSKGLDERADSFTFVFMNLNLDYSS